MCLELRKKRTNSTYFNRHSYQSFYLEFPCGKCAECVELARTNYYVRTYFQSRECFDGDGFIVFDTLTYDDAHLPHLSDFCPDIPDELDFSCFDYHDVQAFLKRLRRAMDYRGYDVRNKFKYFISSEYGKGDVYVDDRGRFRQGTFRPHYHCLFFLNSRDIDPVEFSRLVNTCWQKGRTDGVDTHGESFFRLKNLFGRGCYQESDASLRRVCSYVAKYVTKDPDYKAMLDDRERRITDHYVASIKDACDRRPDYMAQEGQLLRYAVDALSHVSMFHRQSVGYGLYGISDWRNVDEIWREGTISMPDARKVVAHFVCPRYYRIKLFYDLRRSELDGKYYYVLNDDGKEFRHLQVRRTIAKGVDRVKEWYMNLRQNEKDFVDGLLVDEDTGLVRTFEDFVTYRNVYRGRILDMDDGYVPDVDEMVDRWSSFSPLDPLNQFMPRMSDHHDTNFPYRKPKYFISTFDPFEADRPMDHVGMDSIMASHRRYLDPSTFVISQNTLPDFANFDRLCDFYDETMKSQYAEKQAVFDIKEKTLKFFKNLSCFS